MKFFAVEGNSQWLDGGAMFGNAPKELWKKWIDPDQKNRIHLATRTLLVETDQGKRILFDAGVGTFFDPKLRERYGVVEEEHMLLKNLKALGVDEDSIDGVILSHLHFDHCGGLLSSYQDGPLKLLFPNATVYVGKRHWERALHPHPREKASFIPKLHQLLLDSNRLQLLTESHHPDLPEVTFKYFDGHTTGLVVSEIENFVFLSDLIPAVPWVHVPITMGYDRFAEKAVDEKEDYLNTLVQSNKTVCFVHDLNVSFAHIQKNAKGRFIAEPISV